MQSSSIEDNDGFESRRCAFSIGELRGDISILQTPLGAHANCQALQ